MNHIARLIAVIPATAPMTPLNITPTGMGALEPFEELDGVVDTDEEIEVLEEKAEDTIDISSPWLIAVDKYFMLMQNPNQ
ncbi:hypothetical protein BDQ17DRAFT_1437146 [Cyathus striatus]|nr:hypothetical protein BDQ17DRAFT_1437146 [Cyathus striatus]